jgi:hypothetical protein
MGLELKTLQQKLEEALQLLREAVDISVRIKAQEPKNQALIVLWEEFLGQFWSYLRKKSKESGQNLLAGISLFGRRH